jgi:hypothetical protein
VEKSYLYKTKISKGNILLLIIVLFIICQYDSIVEGNFLSRTSWIIFAVLLAYIVLFNLFFYLSVEIYSDYLIINHSIPFIIKPKKYYYNDIIKVVIYNFGSTISIRNIQIHVSPDNRIKKYLFPLVKTKSFVMLEKVLKDYIVVELINSPI